MFHFQMKSLNIFGFLYLMVFISNGISNPDKFNGCLYEDQYYGIDEVVWTDPECRCTVLVCAEDGKVHLQEKEKPCCLHDGKPYGNGEVIYTGDCHKFICKEGKLISLPHCQKSYEIVTFNGIASCYHLSSSLLSYNDANEYCKSIDGSLAQITSLQENEALEDYLFTRLLPSGYKSGWLGASARVNQYGYLHSF